MNDEPKSPACTVLCIEDDADLSAMIRLLLGMASDVRVLGTRRGEEGCVLAHEYGLALILLDLRLPDIPGTEVLRRLKASARTGRIPVIMLNAEVSSPSASQLLELGAAYCLQKPFTVENFLNAIETVAASI